MATTHVDFQQPVFLDTNFLLRANISTAPLHLQTLSLLKDLWENDTELWISRQVLREFLASVTRSQTFMSPLPAAIAVEQTRYLQKRFLVANETPPVTDKLLELIEQIPTGGKQIHDANIAATMIVQGIKQLLTYNAGDFIRFSGYITVISPETLTETPKDEQE